MNDVKQFFRHTELQNHAKLRTESRMDGQSDVLLVCSDGDQYACKSDLGNKFALKLNCDFWDVHLVGSTQGRPLLTLEIFLCSRLTPLDP